MKKFFYTLCVSALLFFTGCFATPPPSNFMSESGRIVKKFCDVNPGEEACGYLADKTELSPKEVKPVMKLNQYSMDTETIYGASAPIAWFQGYSNLPLSDYNNDMIPYTINFSVERGSVLITGAMMDYWRFNPGRGEFFGHQRTDVTGTKGGESYKALEPGHKEIMVMQFVVFPELGKYFFLPPLRTAP